MGRGRETPGRSRGTRNTPPPLKPWLWSRVQKSTAMSAIGPFETQAAFCPLIT